MAKGILTVTDALLTLVGNQTTVLQVGTTQVYAQIQEENAAYNRVVSDELSTFCEMSSDVTRIYGGADVIASEDMTELDNPDSSKVGDGYPISFPLTRHGSKTGWTRDFLATNSADKLAAQYLAMRSGDQLKIQSKIRRAIYYPISRPVYTPGTGVINPNAYRDLLIPPLLPLPIYPLLNADGQPVPIGPNGETFDPATHTHYMASDWTAGASTPSTRDGDLQAACINLTEHKIDGNLMLVIHASDESKIRALSNFVRDYDSSVTVGANLTYAGNALDVKNLSNRRIGTFNGFEVWVKPWAYPSYIVPMCEGTVGGMRPLVWRTRVDGLWSDFNSRNVDDDFPTTADTYTRDGDCGVWQRHMAVVLFIGGPIYQTPVKF